MDSFYEYEKNKMFYLYLKKDILPKGSFVYNESKNYKYMNEKYKYKLFGGNRNTQKDIFEIPLIGDDFKKLYIPVDENEEYLKRILEKKSGLLELGEGGNGKVYLDPSRKYIIKHIPLQKGFNEEKDLGIEAKKDLKRCNILYPLASISAPDIDSTYNYILYEYGGKTLEYYMYNELLRYNSVKNCFFDNLGIIRKIAEHLNCMYNADYVYTDLKDNNIVYKEVDEDTEDAIKVKTNTNFTKYIKIKIIDVDGFIKLSDSFTYQGSIIKSISLNQKYTYTPSRNSPVERLHELRTKILCPILVGFVPIIYKLLRLDAIYFRKDFDLKYCIKDLDKTTFSKKYNLNNSSLNFTKEQLTILDDIIKGCLDINLTKRFHSFDQFISKIDQLIKAAN